MSIKSKCIFLRINIVWSLSFHFWHNTFKSHRNNYQKPSNETSFNVLPSIYRYTVRKKKLEKLFESGGLVIPHHSRQAHSRNSHIFVTCLNSINVRSMQDTTPNHFQQFLYIALLRMGFLFCILLQLCLLLYKRISLKCESIFFGTFWT